MKKPFNIDYEKYLKHENRKSFGLEIDMVYEWEIDQCSFLIERLCSSSLIDGKKNWSPTFTKNNFKNYMFKTKILKF